MMALTKCQTRQHRPYLGLPAEPQTNLQGSTCALYSVTSARRMKEGHLPTHIFPNFHSYKMQQQTPVLSADNSLGQCSALL